MVGRVETGTVKLGMTVKFAPSNHFSKITNMEMNHEEIKEAGPEDRIQF